MCACLCVRCCSTGMGEADLDLTDGAQALELASGRFTGWQSTDRLLKKLTRRWQTGEISNFQYLMHLNTLAGRSYNDLTQVNLLGFVCTTITTIHPVFDMSSDDTNSAVRLQTSRLPTQVLRVTQHLLRSTLSFRGFYATTPLRLSTSHALRPSATSPSRWAPRMMPAQPNTASATSTGSSQTLSTQRRLSITQHTTAPQPQ